MGGRGREGEGEEKEERGEGRKGRRGGGRKGRVEGCVMAFGGGWTPLKRRDVCDRLQRSTVCVFRSADWSAGHGRSIAIKAL